MTLASSRPAPGATSGLRLPMVLALLALVSLALLGSWHDMHPNVDVVAHGTSLEHAAAADDPDMTDHPDYLDHVASHAGLHAIGLPAFPATTARPLRPVALWHAASRGLLTSIDPARDLRPPRI